MAAPASCSMLLFSVIACDGRASSAPDPGIGPPQVTTHETAQSSGAPVSVSPATPAAVAAPKDGKTVVVDPPPFVRRPCAHQGTGKAYEVGPGKAFASVEDVPWEKLGAGDTVMIFHRKDPYRSKILISRSGTATQPLRVCGVLGPKGERPVLDGENAVARKTPVHAYEPQQDRGLVIVSLDKEDRYGTKPSHVVIEGLEIRNAFRDLPFTGQNGDRRKYLPLSAGVFVERGEDITIRDCLVQKNGNGIFVASGSDEATLSRRILIEGNEIRENGTPGDGFDRRHNVYGEAAGIVYQFNHLGPLRDGAGGSAIKDRSIGTVVRYNWIEGGARQLDMVEPEDANAQLHGHVSFDEAWVYGNVLLSDERGSSNVVHFGGDTGMEDKYRKGPLHFFSNTVVVRVDQQKRWRTSLFQLESNGQTAKMASNVVWAFAPQGQPTELALMNASGKLEVGAGNVVGPAFGDFPQGREAKGSVVGSSAITKVSTSPFVDAARGDFTPAAALLGKAGPPENKVFHADFEYVATCASRSRAGKADVGALSPSTK